MALNSTTLSIGAQAMADSITHLSIHTTGPVSSSADESAAARVACTWNVSNGVITLSAPVNFTGGASSGAAVRVGYWSASTAGTYRGGALLTGDQTFNAAGEYTVNSITETGSSS